MSVITNFSAWARRLTEWVTNAAAVFTSTPGNKATIGHNPISQGPSEQYVIRGVILPQDVASRVGIRVQAFDRDMPSLERRPGSELELLGEAAVDTEGRFQITYTSDRLRRGEQTAPPRRIGRTSADISFRLVDRAGHELKIKSFTALDQEYRADQIIFNAPSSLQVSIAIETPAGSTDASDYEQLVAFLSPVIRDVPIAELSDDDIAFIHRELKIAPDSVAPQRIEWLRRCALLARETGVAAEAFYGWGRRNVPADLTKLLQVAPGYLSTIPEKLTELPEQALRSGLVAAIDENIVPANFRSRVTETVRLLKRRGQVRRSVTAQLHDDSGELPLAAHTVTVFDVNADNENRGMYIANKAGRFSFDFYHSRQITPGYQERAFRLEIRSPSGGALPDGGALTVSLARPETEVVHVSVRTLDADAGNRHQHFKSLSADPSMALLRSLPESHGIRTLADIRRKGGLRKLTGLPKSNPAALHKLDALAAPF